MLLPIAIFVTHVISQEVQGFDIVQFLHKGCYKDQSEYLDLPFKASKNASKSVKSCVDACTENYFMYAGLQNGQYCYCGNSYGRYGPSSDCKTRCSESKSEICGGFQANNVYDTKIKVPGPPSDLKLIKSKENSLKIHWEPPKYAIENFTIGYVIQVEVNDSFDPSHNQNTFSPKIIKMSEASRMTVILGLKPGSKYNVTVKAASKEGPGKAVQAFFWTQIGAPVAPDPPVLVQHSHDHHGEIHVQLKGLRLNKYGPISKYQVLVIDETNPAPFTETRVFDYFKAKDQGLNYWAAAEFPSEEFTRDVRDIEFVVGDNKTYGKYFNFGPLPEGRDFHVTLGVVSTWNGITKVSFSKAVENY